MTSNELEQAIAKGRKVSVSEGFKYATELGDKDITKPIVIKISNKTYEKWYETTPKKYTLEEETTYLTYTTQKAFISRMGGYSIFGQSMASLKRKDNGGELELDRIEHFDMDYFIILD